MPTIRELGPSDKNERILWVRGLRSLVGLPSQEAPPSVDEARSEQVEMLCTADRLDELNRRLSTLREALLERATPTADELETYTNHADRVRAELVKTGDWDGAIAGGKELEEHANRVIKEFKHRRKLVASADKIFDTIDPLGMVSSRARALQGKVRGSEDFALAFEYNVAIGKDNDKVGPMRAWLERQAGQVDDRVEALRGTEDLTAPVTAALPPFTAARGKSQLRSWREATVPLLEVLDTAEAQARQLALQRRDLADFVDRVFPSKIAEAIDAERGETKKQQRRQQLEQHQRNITERWLPRYAGLSRDHRLADQATCEGTLAAIRARMEAALGTSMGKTAEELQTERAQQDWTAFTQGVHAGWVALTQSHDHRTSGAWDRRLRGIFPRRPVPRSVRDRLTPGKTVQIGGGSYRYVSSDTTGMSLHRVIPEDCRPEDHMQSYIFHMS